MEDGWEACQRHKAPPLQDSAIPTFAQSGALGESLGPRGLGVGNALAELRAPGESRKMARQVISPEHNTLAEVSTLTQSEKLLLPFPTAKSSLPATLPQERSAKGPLT